MPPYQRYWNYHRRNYWRRRRFAYRYRRPRKAFRRRWRRRRPVRRRHFKRKIRRKLRKLNIVQWQPNHIRRCKIQGFLQLFGCGIQRVTNNFAMFKDSWVPEHEPGGGGWSIQQLTLSNLYTQNQYLQNWWTQSNRGLNLCRYIKCKIVLYRQQWVDYVFNYRIEPPYDVTKYYYASNHPYKLLLSKHRIVVPSFKTQPNDRRKYIKKTIYPPRHIKNEWYFQQNFAKLPLLEFTVSACSLLQMYMGTKSISNNISLWSINTRFFKNPRFQYPMTGGHGYTPQFDSNVYIYGAPTLEPLTPNWKENKIVNNVVYLGDTMTNDEGHPITNTSTAGTYTRLQWGNPFYHKYLHGEMITFITDKTLSEVIAMKDSKISQLNPQLKTEPFIIRCRYNPWKDKGTGNVAYWISNLDQSDWEIPKDPDLSIRDFPLWILLWGWQELTEKVGKIRIMSGNYMLVVRTNYIDEKLPAYVFVSDSYVDGNAPYNRDPHEITTQDFGHWYPRFKFQKECVEAILSTGPAVCRLDQKNIEAHMKYNLFFKWGGNPAQMENVYDPLQQPIFPIPNQIQLTSEINNPEQNLKNYIYTFDTRGDILTEKATKRIKELSSDDESLFTDGEENTTDAPLPYKAQEKTTSEKEKETPVQQQLQLIKQCNKRLRKRLLQLQQLALTS
nr:MAG: ORF1 [TTV-like mini virus]